MPKVSVLMPVYNTNENFLREAISSILSQTLKDFELIIINDASTNNAEDVILSYNDSRIKYYKNPQNLGISVTRNKLFDLAQGEYFAIMDSDDISLPNRLAEQVSFMDSHPEVGLCGGWIDIFTCTERKNDGRHSYKISYLDLLKGWCINQPTVMLRSSIIQTFNLRYDINYSCAEDYELWSRLIRYTQIINLQKVLVKYRWHNTNTSITKDREMKKLTAQIKQNMLDFLSSSSKEQENIKFIINTNKKLQKHKSKVYFLGIPILTIKSCVND